MGVNVLVVNRLHRHPFVVGLVKDILHVVRLVAFSCKSAGDGVVLSIVHREQAHGVTVDKTCGCRTSGDLVDRTTDIERNEIRVFNDGLKYHFLGARGNYNSHRRQS